ncbi:MAG: hypothetical protein RJA70_4142 [Pseudomonadota bacterium]|jgi:Fic family protein
MQASEFKEPFPGELVAGAGGLLTFVPHPLLETLVLPPRVMILASEAERAIGRLGGLLVGGGNPINPHLVGRPLQRREAIESSRIEGTFTTPEQLVIFEDEDEPEGGAEANGDTSEVQNYMVALDWALTQLSSLPVSSRLIRGIHERLLRGVRGGDQHPGEFRDIQNFIGRTQDPRDARFVPPPPAQVPDLIAALERYIHVDPDQRSLVRLVRIALIHYQFETIHPFRDGNGRVGRILIPLLLKSDEPADPPLYLSGFFEQRRRDYYDLMLAVSQRGEFTEWIAFFLTAINESVRSALDMADRLFKLRTAYHRVAQDKKWPAACLPLIDALFEYPLLTIKRVEHLVSVTTPTASAHLRKLQEAGIVREYTGRQRNRKYLAQEILHIVHGTQP